MIHQPTYILLRLIEQLNKEIKEKDDEIKRLREEIDSLLDQLREAAVEW